MKKYRFKIKRGNSIEVDVDIPEDELTEAQMNLLKAELLRAFEEAPTKAQHYLLHELRERGTI